MDGNLTKATGVGETRKPLHAHALSEFRRLHNVINELEILTDHIRGEDRPREIEPDKKQPENILPLEQYLRQTPEEISTISDRIANITERIRSALY